MMFENILTRPDPIRSDPIRSGPTRDIFEHLLTRPDSPRNIFGKLFTRSARRIMTRENTCLYCLLVVGDGCRGHGGSDGGMSGVGGWRRGGVNSCWHHQQCFFYICFVARKAWELDAATRIQSRVLCVGCCASCCVLCLCVHWLGPAAFFSGGSGGSSGGG